MKLSIGILLYNTNEAQFENCLSSIAKSTLDDYEIICIDDGSQTDYSSVLQKFDRIRYVKTENRGIFAQRLFAIALAEGEYFTFVDSDDFVSLNYHQPMVDKAVFDDADIVLNDWAFETDRFRTVCQHDSTVSGDFSYTGEQCLRAFFEQEGREHSFYVLWNKVFRTSLLKQAKAQIERLPLAPSPYNYSEDTLINFFAFKYAKKVENTHTGYYFYRVSDTQSVAVTSEKKLAHQILCMTYTFAQMEQNIADNSFEASIRKHLAEWRALMSRTHYSYAKRKKYIDLYQTIISAYGTPLLQVAKFSDGKAYVGSKILPSNLEEIENALRPLFKVNRPTDVCYRKNDTYAVRVIAYLCEQKGKILAFSPSADVVIPPEQISFSAKVFHNPIIYRIGMALFPKGSKIRAFLKKRF